MTLYEITNIVTGMGYVGITKNNVEERWTTHKSTLKRGVHHNIRLQRAYDKYGRKSFKYVIRQKFNTIEEMENAEIYILKNEKDRLYNIKEGGYNAFFQEHTVGAKIKIGESGKIPVVGMSIKTGEIREYACGMDTAIDGFNSKNIGKCCALAVSNSCGRTQQAISTSKWVWMYKDEFDLEEMKRRAELAQRRGNNDQSRAVIGKSLIDGSLINFRSCLEAEMSIPDSAHQSIHKACKGGAVKQHKGYVWAFADEDNPQSLLEERYFYALSKFNGKRAVRTIRPLIGLNLQTNEIKEYFSNKSIEKDGFYLIRYSAHYKTFRKTYKRPGDSPIKVMFGNIWTKIR